MWNFERFNAGEVKSGHSRHPAITIHKNKAVTLSAAAIREYELQDCTSVVLYWDAKKRAIGIENANGPESFAVSHVKSAARISCRAFVRHICVTETTRVALKKDKETGFLVAELPPASST